MARRLLRNVNFSAPLHASGVTVGHNMCQWCLSNLSCIWSYLEINFFSCCGNCLCVYNPQTSILLFKKIYSHTGMGKNSCDCCLTATGFRELWGVHCTKHRCHSFGFLPRLLSYETMVWICLCKDKGWRCRDAHSLPNIIHFTSSWCQSLDSSGLVQESEV